MATLKLSPPWVRYYQEVNAMFKNDPGVYVLLDEDNYILSVYVDDQQKADALNELLPQTKEFGNTTLTIKVIPANVTPSSGFKLNQDSDDYYSYLFKNAFRGNSVLKYVRAIKSTSGFAALYVVFSKEVVQYFNDDLSDINGVCSTLYQEIAKDIFVERRGVFYCTDTDEKCYDTLWF